MKKVVIAVCTLLLTASVAMAVDIKAPSMPATPAVDTKGAAPAMELIDINSATEAELKAIPGIGDEYAKKIVAGRPFSNKSQLLSKKIIPKGVYDKVKNMIIAKAKK